MYPAINLGCCSIGTFTLCFGLGLMAAVLLTLLQLRKGRVSIELQNKVLPCIPFGLLVGIIVSVLVETILCHGWRAMFTGHFKCGINFFGWLIGFLSFLKIYAAVARIPTTYLMCLFLPSVAVAQGFGRIGCFLGGCCWGRPVHPCLGVQYPSGGLSFEMYGNLPLFPVQLVESMWLFAVACILFFRIKSAARADWYFLLVGGGRFALEFMRGDPRGAIMAGLPLSPAQCIGIVLVLYGFIRRINAIAPAMKYRDSHGRAASMMPP